MSSRPVERYVDELLDRAKSGLPSGPGAPGQVALRRSASDLYYAAFHFLIDQIATQLLRTSNAQRQARHVLSRGLTHVGLRDGCKKLSAGPLTGSLAAGLPSPSPLPALPTPVRQFAVTFVELQELRHDADYNWNTRLAKGDVDRMVKDVRVRIQEFREVPVADPGRQWFLSALAVWPELKRR